MKFKFGDKESLIIEGETDFERQWIKKHFPRNTYDSHRGCSIWGAIWNPDCISSFDEEYNEDNPILEFFKMANQKKDLLKGE